MPRSVRIGCYSAFWGDSVSAARQLVEAEDAQLDYLVADYLAEVTMGLLARNYKFPVHGKPGVGYISEFLSLVLAPLLDAILKKKVKVIANAGGLDPIGLKELIEAHARKVGLADQVKVAAVFGDDLLDRQDIFLQSNIARGFDPLNGVGQEEEILRSPNELLSLNAYTGAAPIAEALKRGANIIVTGRCVDSAAVVGPLAFEFGWDLSSLKDSDILDCVASASLIGHILECGAQATGGNFTDWKLSAFSRYGGWANMGYPIATVHEDGSAIISKPEKTGGLVTRDSVAEQIMYEVLDPANYILPDVVIDLTKVRLTQVAPEQVMVQGVKGKPPTPWLKCTAIAHQGFRINADLLVWGNEAESKAFALGSAIIERTNNVIFSTYQGKVPPIHKSDTNILIVGSDHSVSQFSPTISSTTREVVLRVWAKHSDKAALNILGQEVSSLVTSSAPGITVFATGRPKSGPNLLAASILVDRKHVLPKLLVGGCNNVIEVPFQLEGCQPIDPSATAVTFSPRLAGPIVRSAPRSIFREHNRIKLIDVAIGRSGDKGDNANVAIIARHPDYYPFLLDQVTPQAIYGTLGHLL
ncbi:hypothetical protein FB567DRAFT_606111, partial [Paraphoma chrysanthemicola]